jgi:hypothetical protein
MSGLHGRVVVWLLQAQGESYILWCWTFQYFYFSRAGYECGQEHAPKEKNNCIAVIDDGAHYRWYGSYEAMNSLDTSDRV